MMPLEERVAGVHRVDFPGKSLVGWRVHVFRRDFSFVKFFSDSKYLSKSASYVAAKTYASSLGFELTAEKASLESRFRLRRNSKTGMPGVTRYVEKRTSKAFWLAYWTGADGKKITRKFSVRRLGESEARNAAIETRNKSCYAAGKRLAELQRKFEIIHSVAERV